jgi:hypothetical protein
MDEGKVKFPQQRNVAGNTPVYVPRVMVVLKVFVVSINFYLVLRPKQQVAPAFKGMDDSEEFSVVNVIAPFRRR